MRKKNERQSRSEKKKKEKRERESRVWGSGGKTRSFPARKKAAGNKTTKTNKPKGEAWWL